MTAALLHLSAATRLFDAKAQLLATLLGCAYRVGPRVGAMMHTFLV